jgi:hypothetical protein
LYNEQGCNKAATPKEYTGRVMLFLS